MQAHTCVVDFSPRRLVSMKTIKTGCGRINVDAWRLSEIDEAVVSKTAKTLQEGLIYWSEFSVCSKAIIIRAGAQFRKQNEIVSANVIIRESRSVVTLRRETDIKSDQFVLGQNR